MFEGFKQILCLPFDESIFLGNLTTIAPDKIQIEDLEKICPFEAEIFLVFCKDIKIEKSEGIGIEVLRGSNRILVNYLYDPQRC